jgi:hypothetical protein
MFWVLANAMVKRGASEVGMLMSVMDTAPQTSDEPSFWRFSIGRKGKHGSQDVVL